MSFGESVFLAGFNQKTAKEDLFIKGNHRILTRNRCGKTLEDSKRRITKAGHVSLTCGATQPLWAPPISLIVMSVLHHLNDYISTVL